MKSLLITSSPGSGKTTATAEAIRRHGVSARIVTGNLKLAQEMADEYGYSLIAGRNRTNCERYDVVRALGSGGHDVEKLACGSLEDPRCPARSYCSYFGQYDQPGPRVAAAEQMYNRHFLAGGSLLVADDADLMRSTISRFIVTVEELATACNRLKGKRRVAIRRLLTVLGQAIMSSPEREDGRPERLLGSAAWDHIARTAKLYGHDITDVLHALPKRSSLPEPQADGSGVLTVEAVDAAPSANLTSLINALRDEIELFESGEDFNSRIRLSREGIEVRVLREHICDRWGQPLVAQMDMLVLDATPMPALVDRLTKHHEPLPDLDVTIKLPENVRVRQYATSTNGHAVLNDERRVDEAVAEVMSESKRHPVEAEGIVCFAKVKPKFIEAGFDESRIVTFGRVRGTNALADVDRIQVVGRPMPPIDELPYLAQVIHFGEEHVSGQLLMRPEAFGGQPYEVDVQDYADPRLAALLKGVREDEIVQAIHRGRLFSLSEPQLRLVGESSGEQRRQVELVLHTSLPIPGLRVDELILKSEVRDVNRDRKEDAEQRIRSAVLQLQEQCLPITTNRVAEIAGAHKATVAKYMKEVVHTLSRDPLFKGMNHLPLTPPPSPSGAEIDADSENDHVNRCLGGCGKPMPAGRCFECATRKTIEEMLAPKLKRRSR